MAEPTTADASDASVAPAGKKSNTFVMIVAAVLAIGAAAGGAYWLGSKKETTPAANEDVQEADKDGKTEKLKGPAIYVEFDPPFVVNFEARGMTRFLQVTVQVMTRDPATAEMIKSHDPVIRNDMLMLFSNQSYETISTREGKEKLRSEALEVVSKVIASEGGKGKYVEQLYFTSFVMQ
jgi:flagellar FliL protein